MTAAALTRGMREGNRSGLRPISPRKDMGRMANLIETSFAGELDQAALVMMREMRFFSRLGWMGHVFGRLFLPPAAYPDGFVWEEDGELIGNASLLPVGRGSLRWVLANVAVHPGHRRQGIARELVLACLERGRARGAREIVLQVNHENQGAIRLYEQLEFRELTTRSEWVRKAVLLGSLERRGQVRSRHRAEWHRQWRWAQRLFPEGIQWPYELNQDWFAPPGWLRTLSPVGSKHWVAEDRHGDLQGSLTARYSRDHQGWQLGLLLPPPSRESIAESLLAHAVASLARSGMTVHLSYPHQSLAEVLSRMGFRRRKTLTWMGRTLA